ncbi:hypothetical protein MAPG_03304 [Magnaporthiopsis poae ATCC 64411]|uniref:Large ribosomal subunit protein mL67 n=1 Tax=Magnaporthiopsis poae (strain ATCC 64411 / 73-15) TaxID=644358 RepID=A0A0C4DTN3_MAGP6|nr:hypothetical protein MAPG_03304 [Magnaporthiopsis poae ATCC 64411]
MNIAPARASLLRLSAGLSRVSVRHGSHLARYKKPQPEKSGFWPGHGEKIWVFNNIVTGQVVYSTKPVLDSNRALKQLPFNGKKTKPAKLRKDYWKPMAIIKFQEGDGDIGRSVLQKLREFRRLHELSWGYQTDEFYAMSKKDRGKALNNQKPNTVADIAAVLGGAGRGNLIWRKPEVEDADADADASVSTPAPAPTATAIATATKDDSALAAVTKGDSATATATEGDSATTTVKATEGDSATVTVPKGDSVKATVIEADSAAPAEQPSSADAEEEGKEEVAAVVERKPPFAGATLAHVMIFWATKHDATFAQGWPSNVHHKLGLETDVIEPEVDELEEESLEPSTEEASTEEELLEASSEAASTEDSAAQSQEKPRAPRSADTGAGPSP